MRLPRIPAKVFYPLFWVMWALYQQLEFYTNLGRFDTSYNAWAWPTVLTGMIYFSVEVVRLLRGSEKKSPNEKKPKHDADN